MPQSSTSKSISIGAIGLAIVAAVGAVLADLSESKLVAFSYLIVPLLVFGVAGLSVAKGNLKGALALAGVSLLALFVFLVAIFPML